MSQATSTLRVFLSSTSADLEGYRDRVASLVQHGFGQFAVTMNYFPLEPHKDATRASLDQLAACQVYILLLAWRYGFVPDGQAGEALSVTHQEYREARRLGLPCFVFLADERTQGDLLQFPLAARDLDHTAQLSAFRAEVQRQQLVGFFTTEADLVNRVVAALHRYLLAQGRLGQVPWDLPPTVPGFVGREQELATLCANLRQGRATQLSAALAGLGGVGKSALASEAVRRLAAEPGAFPGGIAFVRCDGQTGLEGLATVEQRLLDTWELALSPAQQAQAAASAAAEVEVKEQVLRRRLRARLQPPPAMQGGGASGGGVDDAPLPAESAALALLDNVEVGLPIDRLLDLLSGVGVTVLVTARHLLSSTRVQTQRLETLEPDAARTLFGERYLATRQSLGLTAAPEQMLAASAAGGPVDALVTLLGALPLAVELAASRAARLGLSPVEAAQEIQEAQRRGELLVDPQNPTKSLGTVLDKSLATLSARQRLRFAALSLPQGPDWPRATIEAFLAHLRLPPTMSAATVGGMLVDHKEAALDDALGEALDTAAVQEARADLDALVSFSLVAIMLEQVTEGDEGHESHCEARVRVHPLLRERAQREWEQSCKQNTMLRKRGAAALVQAVSQTLLPYARVPQSYAHLDTETALLEGALTTLALVDKAAETQQRVAQTIDALFSYLTVGGRWRLGARLLQVELNAWRQVGDRAGEGTTLNNLGQFASSLGKLMEARRYFEQALAVKQEAGDRSSEATTLNNLGALALVRGQWEEAHRHFEQALAIAQEVGDRAGGGTTLNNLGELLRRMGLVEEAQQCFEQVLVVKRDMGDREGEGATLNNLGLLLANSGQVGVARRYYQQALAISREVGNRAGEGTLLNNLGELAFRLVQFGEARRYYEQGLAIYREVGDRAGEGTAMHNMGALALTLGQWGEARRCYEQALAIARDVGDRTLEADALGELGFLFGELGEWEGAQRSCMQALRILREMGDLSGEADVLNHLGALVSRQGRVDEAVTYYEQALALYNAAGMQEEANMVRTSLARLRAPDGR